MATKFRRQSVMQAADAQHRLPAAAQQWLDDEIARLNGVAGAVNGCDKRPTAGGSVGGVMPSVRYSIKAFRDLQFMRYPETAVAGLAISDELFLDLIWHGLYQVCDLVRALDAGTPIEFAYASSGSAHGAACDEAMFALLADAVAVWQEPASGG